jgi:hypothetical protein
MRADSRHMGTDSRLCNDARFLFHIKPFPNYDWWKELSFSIWARDHCYVRKCTPLTPFFARIFRGLFITWISDSSTLNMLKGLFMETVFIQNGFCVHSLCSGKQQALRLPNRNFRISFKEWTKSSVTHHVLLVRRFVTDTQLLQPV